MGSGQTKAYDIDSSFFVSEHAAKKKKSKDLLARNQVNVSDWSNMFTLLFQRTNTIKIQLLSEHFQNEISKS
jgi:hypothetical protein